jgi:ubiquitin C-terminal hydrolase
LIESIKAAKVAGETEKVSAVKHLRELLAKMHAEYNTQTGKTINPKMFQLAVAYGAAEDAIRNAMDGTVQQDAFEYYQLLLNILLEDSSLANEEAFRAQFEIETETHDKCTACNHKSEPRIATNNYHGIDIPLKSKLDEWDTTSDLFAKSLYSPKEGECDKCKKTELQSQTSFTRLPENIFVKLNRTRFGKNEATKVETSVPYAETIFPQIKSNKPERYELFAVVMHEGATIEKGHYTIYRQQNGHWFWLDDGQCEQVAWSEVKDLAKFAGDTPTSKQRSAGHSAMMLYKKAPVGI